MLVFVDVTQVGTQLHGERGEHGHEGTDKILHGERGEHGHEGTDKGYDFTRGERRTWS